MGGKAATDAAGALAAGGAPIAGMAKPPAAGAVELGAAGAPIGGIVKPLERLGAGDVGAELARPLGAGAGGGVNELGGADGTAGAAVGAEAICDGGAEAADD